MNFYSARCGPAVKQRPLVAFGASVVQVRGTPRSGVAISFLFESVKKEFIISDKALRTATKAIVWPIPED